MSWYFIVTRLAIPLWRSGVWLSKEDPWRKPAVFSSCVDFSFYCPFFFQKFFQMRSIVLIHLAQRTANSRNVIETSRNTLLPIKLNLANFYERRLGSEDDRSRIVHCRFPLHCSTSIKVQRQWILQSIWHEGKPRIINRNLHCVWISTRWKYKSIIISS